MKSIGFVYDKLKKLLDQHTGPSNINQGFLKKQVVFENIFDKPVEDKHKRATFKYIRLLDSKREDVRIRAALWLGRTRSVSGLVKLLDLARNSAETTPVRLAAIWSIGEMRSNLFIHEIGSLMKDPDPHIRWATMSALVNIGSTEAFNHLLEGLLDGDSLNRIKARVELSVNIDRTVYALLAGLRREDLAGYCFDILLDTQESSLPHVFYQYVTTEDSDFKNTLKSILHHSEISLFIGVAEKILVFPEDNEDAFRELTALLIARSINELNTLEPVREVLRRTKNDAVKEIAIKALVKFSDFETVPILRSLLEDEYRHEWRTFISKSIDILERRWKMAS